MCHYEQILWTCGYWRWDRFRKQCPRENRIGETCGLRLIYDTVNKDRQCRLCEDIAKKERRLFKMEADMTRWRHEGNKPATVEKTMHEYCRVWNEHEAMTKQHDRVVGMDRERSDAGLAYAAAGAAVKLPSMRSVPAAHGMATPRPSPRTSPSPGGSPPGGAAYRAVKIIKTPEQLGIPGVVVAQVSAAQAKAVVS